MVYHVSEDRNNIRLVVEVGTLYGEDRLVDRSVEVAWTVDFSWDAYRQIRHQSRALMICVSTWRLVSL